MDTLILKEHEQTLLRGLNQLLNLKLPQREGTMQEEKIQQGV